MADVAEEAAIDMKSKSQEVDRRHISRRTRFQASLVLAVLVGAICLFLMFVGALAIMLWVSGSLYVG